MNILHKELILACLNFAIQMQKVNIILNNYKDDSLNNLMEYKSAYINLRHNLTIDRCICIKALNLKKHIYCLI